MTGEMYLMTLVVGTAIESMALETERISEGQRFVTKLLAERDRVGGVLPSRDP